MPRSDSRTAEDAGFPPGGPTPPETDRGGSAGLIESHQASTNARVQAAADNLLTSASRPAPAFAHGTGRGRLSSALFSPPSRTGPTIRAIRQRDRQ